MLEFAALFFGLTIAAVVFSIVAVVGLVLFAVVALPLYLLGKVVGFGLKAAFGVFGLIGLMLGGLLLLPVMLLVGGLLLLKFLVIGLPLLIVGLLIWAMVSVLRPAFA